MTASALPAAQPSGQAGAKAQELSQQGKKTAVSLVMRENPPAAGPARGACALSHSFGNPATRSVSDTDLGPWLCVSRLRGVCLYRECQTFMSYAKNYVELSMPDPLTD